MEIYGRPYHNIQFSKARVATWSSPGGMTLWNATINMHPCARHRSWLWGNTDRGPETIWMFGNPGRKLRELSRWKYTELVGCALIGLLCREWNNTVHLFVSNQFGHLGGASRIKLINDTECEGLTTSIRTVQDGNVHISNRKWGVQISPSQFVARESLPTLRMYCYANSFEY